MKVKIISLFVILMSVSLYAVDAQERAAADVVTRTFGDETASIFSFKMVNEEGNDGYKLSVVNNKVIVEGNSAGALCRGAYDYLKNGCNSIATWSGENLQIPASLPAVDKNVKSPFEFRYYFNVVTHGYTTPYWTWDRWEKELDWMALHGFNMPLLPGATEAIQYRTFLKLGLTPEEAKSFFTGPAHFPWNRMGNVAGWDNQIPDSYFDKQVELNHLILNRMEELGMTPIIPAFAGFVPESFKNYYPEATISKLQWARFDKKNLAPLLLPDNEANRKLFIKAGTIYIQEWEKEFGANRYYLSDTFNEMDVPLSSDYAESVKQMNEYGSTIYKSISQANPDAVWTMQGWTFPFHKNDLGQVVWTPDRLESFVSSIPDDKVLFLDLANDYNVYWWRIPFSWETYKGFFGKKWIYSTIPNMGGKIACTGVLDFYAKGVNQVLSYENKKNLVGYGTAPEGIENNEVIYELISDAAWQSEAVNLEQWISDYCLQKYGYNGPEMISAWKLLQESCYGTFTDHPRHSFQFRPSARMQGSAHDLKKFYEAVEAFASCSDKCDSELYQADLIDFTAQYLGFAADKMIKKSWRKIGKWRLNKFKELNTLLTEMDSLLASHPNLRLERWIEFARAWGDTEAEKDYYESNAKRLITTWGPGVNEYAAKLWSGLVKDYYAKRWMDHANARYKLKKYRPEGWEEQWIKSTWSNTSAKFDNPVEKAAELIEKYKSVVK